MQRWCSCTLIALCSVFVVIATIEATPSPGMQSDAQGCCPEIDPDTLADVALPAAAAAHGAAAAAAVAAAVVEKAAGVMALALAVAAAWECHGPDLGHLLHLTCSPLP